MILGIEDFKEDLTALIKQYELGKRCNLFHDSVLVSEMMNVYYRHESVRWDELLRMSLNILFDIFGYSVMVEFNEHVRAYEKDKESLGEDWIIEELVRKVLDNKKEATQFMSDAMIKKALNELKQSNQ